MLYQVEVWDKEDNLVYQKAFTSEVAADHHLEKISCFYSSKKFDIIMFNFENEYEDVYGEDHYKK